MTVILFYVGFDLMLGSFIKILVLCTFEWLTDFWRLIFDACEGSNHGFRYLSTFAWKDGGTTGNLKYLPSIEKDI